MATNAPNGVKPRYDGGGTEFGLMHRDLGPGFLMFDIDRMSATIGVGLELKRENEAFVEYRYTPVSGIRYVAMMEVKHSHTPYSAEALDLSKVNSIVRADMARRLQCRLFVVYATNGKNPFTFYEYDDNENEFYQIGILDYTEKTRTERVKSFWNDVLRISR